MNQEEMRERMDSMKVKMDKLIEANMVLERKEDNPQVGVDLRNIASQFGSSSLLIPKVANLEFGLP